MSMSGTYFIKKWIPSPGSCTVTTSTRRPRPGSRGSAVPAVPADQEGPAAPAARPPERGRCMWTSPITGSPAKASSRGR